MTGLTIITVRYLFKPDNRTSALQVVSSAKQEFIVLIGVVGVVILLVGTIMYFVEYQIPNEDVRYFKVHMIVI